MILIAIDCFIIFPPKMKNGMWVHEKEHDTVLFANGSLLNIFFSLQVLDECGKSFRTLTDNEYTLASTAVSTVIVYSVYNNFN